MLHNYTHSSILINVDEAGNVPTDRNRYCHSEQGKISFILLEPALGKY